MLFYLFQTRSNHIMIFQSSFITIGSTVSAKSRMNIFATNSKNLNCGPFACTGMFRGIPGYVHSYYLQILESLGPSSQNSKPLPVQGVAPCPTNFEHVVQDIITKLLYQRNHT